MPIKSDQLYVTLISYGSIILAVIKYKIRLLEVIVFTEATVLKTAEAAASVAYQM